jgi:DNA mismatch repair protein MutS2
MVYGKIEANAGEIMFADIEILEFHKILNRLKPYAETDLGKAAILTITPTNQVDDIVLMLDEVETAKTIIERYDTTPLNGVLNVQDALKLAKIGSTLSIEDLLRIVSLIEAASATERFIKKIRQLDIPTTILDHYYDVLSVHSALKRSIEFCIDQKGNITDEASPELASIRKKIQITEKRINEKMESMVRSEASKLTDTLITIRNNRLVLPVRAEYRNSLKGIVHDQSASKETVFIEPIACVELNNQLQSLFAEEQDAIERILYRLSQEVAAVADALIINLDTFTSLDVIFAKAKHAIAHLENKPVLTKNDIKLINARHPLIPKDEVVANTIAFKDYRTIVITGPNTGGKTVALKTLGLLAIMVQSGLFIPVDSGSKTICFSNIFADIGDEQSIEQSLSTFSSHITKIIHILKHVTSNSLVLLDELGSGTDPKEGASLAISILDHIRTLTLFAMVTTHYPELKLYAYNLDDTVNASVEFDIESLKPTFRLQIGIPGTSNALDIAKRLGLDPTIIEKAKAVSLSFDNDTAILIKKLERQSKSLLSEVEAAESLRKELESQKEEQNKLLSASKIKQNQIIKTLEAEKHAEIAEAKDKARKLIEELDQMKKQHLVKEHELAKMKFAVKNLDENKPSFCKTNSQKINVGDRVNVIPYQRTGVVVKQRNATEFDVQLGTLSAVFSEDQLEYADATPETTSSVAAIIQKEGVPSMELDLRGKRYDEAMDLLDKYVDDCLFHHLEFASIIHGYGTGALRKGVSLFVKQNKAIKKSRPGGQNEGGQGVTIIYFK